MATVNDNATPSVTRFRQLLSRKKLQLESESSSSTMREEENIHPNHSKGDTDNVETSAVVVEMTDPLQHDDDGATVMDTSTWAMVGNHLEDETSSSNTHNAIEMEGDRTFFEGEQTFHTADGSPVLFTNSPFGDVRRFERNDEMEGLPILSTDDGFLSPVAVKGVKWADDKVTPVNRYNTTTTTNNTASNAAVRFRKSPYVKSRTGETDDDILPLTPVRNSEALNESFVVSDDESDGEEVEENVADDAVDDETEEGRLFDDFSSGQDLQDGKSERSGGDDGCTSHNTCDSPPSIKESLAFEDESFEEEGETQMAEESSNGADPESKAVPTVNMKEEDNTTHQRMLDYSSLPNYLTAPAENLPESDNHTTTKTNSPSKQTLTSRVKFLATEVRFADQTCVELSTRLKHEKSKSGIYRNNLSQIKHDNARLLQQHEATLRENAKLKGWIQTQKEWNDRQVRDGKEKLAEAERNHRERLHEWESRYQSHFENTDVQIKALNERLAQSLQVNSTLQQKLDRWDHRLLVKREDAALIAEMKERIRTAETAASQADAAFRATQARFYDLQSMHDGRVDELRRERHQREIITHDRDTLSRQCEEFHRLLADWNAEEYYVNDDGSIAAEEFWEERIFASPVKCGEDETPTLNLLARTLRSEQKRRNDASDKADAMRHHADALENALSELRMDCEELKADNGLLEEDLQDKCLIIEEMKVELNKRDETIGILLEEIEGGSGGDETSSEGRMGSPTAGTEAASSSEMDSRIDSPNLASTTSSKSSSSQGYDPKDTADGTSLSMSSNSIRRMIGMNNSTIDDLEGRLEVTQEALESTEEELLATRRKLAKLEEAETLADEMASRLESAEEELAEAEERVYSYEEQLTDLNKELSEVTKELQESKDFSEFQGRTIGTMKLDLANNETRIKEFSIQLKSSLQALMKVEKILRTYEDSDDAVKKKLGEQSRKIIRLEETISAINNHLSASKDAESSSTQTSPRCAHLLAQTPMSNNLSSVRMDSPASAVSGEGYYQEKISDLRNELSNVKERCEEVEKERDDVCHKMKESLHCVQEFRDEMRQQETEHAEEVASLRSQLDAISIQKEALVEKCHKLETKLATMTTDLSNQKAQNKTLAAAENESSRKLAVIIGNNSDVLSENETLRVDIQSLELELQNVNALLHAANAEREGSQNDVKAAKSAFECLQAESILTKKSLQKLEEEISKLRTLLAQKEEELKETLANLETTQEMQASDRVKFDETQQMLEDRHQDQIKDMQAAIQDLERQMSEMEKLRDNSDESFQNASDRIKVLENMVDTQREECELYKAECQDITSLLNKKQEEMLTIQNTLEGAEEELHEERATAHDQRQEIQQLKIKAEEDALCMGAYEESVVEYKKVISEHQSEISNLKRELEDTVDQYQTIVYENEHQINMLQAACDHRQNLFEEQIAKAKEDRNATAADLKSMINSLQAQLNSKDETVSNAKTALASKEQLVGEKDGKIKECMSLISYLKEQLEEQTGAQAQLEEEIRRKQGQIETLQHSLSEASDEIASSTEKLYSLEIAYDELAKIKAANQQELESCMMDIERMKSLHQDEESTSNALIKDFEAEVDNLHTKKNAADESIKALTGELEEASEKLQLANEQIEQSRDEQTKQHHDINELLAQNTTLNKKCNLFKEKLKQQNSKLNDWEASYKLQSKDLVDYGRELSRLIVEKNTLKAELLAVRGSSERYRSKLNQIHDQSVNTPNGGIQSYRPTTN